MKFAYTYAEMRAADRAAIEAGTPEATLMQRAGAALAEAVKRALKRLAVTDVLFVCGGGNNGGDGFVAAQILHEAGVETAVLCLAERFSAGCERARSAYQGEVFTRIPKRRYAVAVDCILGTGIDRPPEGDALTLIEFLENSSAYIISCDLPSGLGAGGIAAGACVHADETVCMGQLKGELLLSDGADTAGEIAVADIGIPAEGGAEVWDIDDLSQYFPKRRSNMHKGHFGTASIFAGGALQGAAFLAAGGALKSGAGYTKLYVTEEYFGVTVGRMPAVVLREFRAVDGELLASDSIAVGMGSGVSERLYAYLVELLTVYTGTLVLDADALNTLSLYGVEALSKKTCRVIVTPHPKEFARLTGESVEGLLRSPVSHAAAFAEKYGVTVVFKNNRTVIAGEGRTAINTTGSPALAKGGSGDVLAGLIAGTCARGVPPFEAACVGCYLLGLAGELAAAELGEYAADATDVISHLPRAMLQVEQK